MVASRLAVLRPPELLEPHPAHHLPQPRRPDRAGDRDSLSLAISRRPDRGAHPEPAGAGRDHGGRDRLVGHRRAGRHHVRSQPAAGIAGRRELRPVRRDDVGHRVLDQSRTRRAGAATAGVADQHPRAHLRSRRLAGARQPQSLRRGALRPAAAERQARHARALLHHGPHLGEPRHAAALSRVRAAERQGLRGGGKGRRGLQVEHGAHQRARRGDRLGRGAGAALPRRARRADAADARRRHRRCARRRAARHLQGVPGGGRRHDRAVVPARRHHRRPGAPPRRRRPARAPAHSLARRDSRTSAAGATRSATSRARSAT